MTFVEITIILVAVDRKSAAQHLRKLASMIEASDAPQWSTIDVNGSATADRNYDPQKP